MFEHQGCCGELHFSNILNLDIDTMTWSSLSTTGRQPGTQDNHSAVLVGHKISLVIYYNQTTKENFRYQRTQLKSR